MVDVLTRLIQIRDECDQTVVDGESWAANRAEEKPLDVERFRVLAHKARRAIAAYHAGDLKELAVLVKEIADETDRN